MDSEIDDLEQRVVIHLDLDCFYAQVEHLRLGIPMTEPLVVQQWGSLLAVNYVARKYGIKRGEHVSEAKLKCPKLHVPHTETLGQDALLVANQNGNNQPAVFDRNRQKVCLRRYREASAAIFAILSKYSDKFERAGIDEAYLDVTERVRTQLMETHKGYRHTGSDTLVYGSEYEDDDSIERFNIEDQMLHLGALIAKEIRNEVKEKLGYIVSAGIAHNKVVSKLASPMNKPDGQTIITADKVPMLLATLPFNKIQGFGGKLGKAIEAQLGVTTAGELQRLNIKELQQHFPEDTSTYIFHRCRGIDKEGVIVKEKIKSLVSAKTFRNHACSLQSIEYWVKLLSQEIYERMCEDEEINERLATKLSISYGKKWGKDEKMVFKSKTIAIPRCNTADSMAHRVMSLLASIEKEAFPCSVFSMSVRDFVAKVTKTGSMEGYFAIQEKKNNENNESNENENDRENHHQHKVEDEKKEHEQDDDGKASKHHPWMKIKKHQGIKDFFEEAKGKEILQADGVGEGVPVSSTERNILDDGVDHFLMNLLPVQGNKIAQDKGINQDQGGKEDESFKGGDKVAAATCTDVAGMIHRREDGALDLESTEESIDVLSCPRCKRMIVAKDWPEHQDYHFAKDLSFEWSEPRETFSSPSSSSSKKKRRKQTTGPLDSYFSRAPS